MTALTSDPAALADHRARFPALGNKSYFNYGGQGPVPQVALDAIRDAYDRVHALGPFGLAAGRWAVDRVEAVRAALAAELGVPPATLSLTEDTTVGCNIALWGLDWQPGDRLLLSDCEHPGIVATARELQRRFGLEIDPYPVKTLLNQGDPVAELRSRLRPTTRLVVASPVLWNTGQVLPLADLVRACRTYPESRRPLQLLADAAQSAGVLPLDLGAIGVDFYAFTGHKWLCGPEGIGGLYVHPSAPSDAVGPCDNPAPFALQPTFIGWRGVTAAPSGDPTGFKPDGRRYEVATSAYPLYAGFEASLAVLNDWGSPGDRYRRLQALAARLWEQLQSVPRIRCLRTVAPPESGLVSFQLVSDAASNAPEATDPFADATPETRAAHGELVKWLEERGFFLRVLADPSCVRACTHYLTLEAEVDALVAALREFVG